jgi:predicted nucleotide-binding protein (sugar kinase/HSP70/actin superfamily)
MHTDGGRVGGHWHARLHDVVDVDHDVVRITCCAPCRAALYIKFSRELLGVSADEIARQH